MSDRPVRGDARGRSVREERTHLWPRPTLWTDGQTDSVSDGSAVGYSAGSVNAFELNHHHHSSHSIPFRVGTTRNNLSESNSYSFFSLFDQPWQLQLPIANCIASNPRRCCSQPWRHADAGAHTVHDDWDAHRWASSLHVYLIECGNTISSLRSMGSWIRNLLRTVRTKHITHDGWNTADRFLTVVFGIERRKIRVLTRTVQQHQTTNYQHCLLLVPVVNIYSSIRLSIYLLSLASAN